MTPAARVQAAIGCLDAILAGAPAEKVLTGWARASRFAGSGDRAAVRDHVFDALRCRRSFAALGGKLTGRGLMIGALRAGGADPGTVFSGARFAPEVLTEAERAGGRPPEPGAEACDLPDWIFERFVSSLGGEAEAAANALRSRAPVHLRVNLARTDRPGAIDRLAAEGVETRPHPAAATALEVTGGARRLRGTAALREGLVELQDAASQAVVEALPLRPGLRVLDYCAGAGGKSLALAALGAEVSAWDIAPRRLAMLPDRAARAGVTVRVLDEAAVAGNAPYDIVLCDAPCSGSGAWRRQPDEKWRLTEARLQELGDIQRGILEKSARLVAPGGVLAYATCSVLDEENSARIQAFEDGFSGFRAGFRKSWSLVDGTDGFFTAHLSRA